MKPEKLDHVVSQIFSAFERANEDWLVGVSSAFGGVESFVRSFFNNPFQPNEYVARLYGAVTAYPAFVRGAVARVLVSNITELLTEDQELHTRVITLDKVVAAFGGEFAAEFLGSFSSPQSVTDLTLLSKIKKPFGNLTFALRPTLAALPGKAIGPLMLLIAVVLEGAMLLFGAVFTVIVIDMLQNRVKGLLELALPQSGKRVRIKQTIYRRIGGVKP